MTRIVRGVFIQYTDEDGRSQTASQGEEVDLTAEEEERLESLEGDVLQPEDYEAPPTEASDLAGDAALNPKPEGEDEDGEGEVGALADGDLSDEEIDALSGPDLDSACAEAGVDTSTGGSLASGAMSADEKRAALKAAQD